MKVQKFIFNDFREITYVVYDEKTNKAIIIDPGCNKDSEKKRLVSYIEKNKLTPVAIVNTHAHLDHIC
jgi:hydroxyacylglutathione hydrolase